MSLKAFHILFITFSGIVTVFLGVWCWRSYSANGDFLYLAMSLASLVAVIALGIYGKWFVRKLKRGDFNSNHTKLSSLAFALTIAAGVFFPKEILACATCYGAIDAPAAHGMNAAILSLLAITGGVLAGFGGFIFYLWKKSRAKV